MRLSDDGDLRLFLGKPVLGGRNANPFSDSFRAAVQMIMSNHFSVKLCLFSLLVALVCACGLGAASVTVSTSGSKGECKEITTPDWQPPLALPGPSGWASLIRDAPLTSDLDFRVVDGGVLVGLIVLPNYPKRGPRLYSPAKYRVDLSTGRVQSATDSEWSSAQPYATLRDSIAEGANMKPEDRLVYKGKEFVRRGAQWPLMSKDASRLSPDGSFLATNSWDGETRICPELTSKLGCRDRIQGSFYVEVYDTGTANILLSLHGQFQGLDPEDLFLRSGWASKGFFVLPLDPASLNRFVLCDIRQAAPKQ